MELYLAWLKRHACEPDEAEPLGVILCAGKSEEHIALLELRKRHPRGQLLDGCAAKEGTGAQTPRSGPLGAGAVGNCKGLSMATRKKPPELTFQEHIEHFLVREHKYGVLEQAEISDTISDTEHFIA